MPLGAISARSCPVPRVRSDSTEGIVEVDRIDAGVKQSPAPRRVVPGA